MHIIYQQVLKTVGSPKKIGLQHTNLFVMYKVPIFWKSGSRLAPIKKLAPEFTVKTKGDEPCQSWPASKIIPGKSTSFLDVKPALTEQKKPLSRCTWSGNRSSNNSISQTVQRLFPTTKYGVLFISTHGQNGIKVSASSMKTCRRVVGSLENLNGNRGKGILCPN